MLREDETFKELWEIIGFIFGVNDGKQNEYVFKPLLVTMINSVNTSTKFVNDMISKYKDFIATKDNNTKTMILNDFLIKSLDIAIKDFNKVIFVIDFIKNFIEMYCLF